MFLHLWFCLQGGSLSRRVCVQEVVCPGESLSRGVLCLGGLCPGGLCPRGSLSRGSLSGGLRGRWSLCRGLCLRGVSVQGGSLGEVVSVWRGLCLVVSLSRRGLCWGYLLGTNRRKNYKSLKRSKKVEMFVKEEYECAVHGIKSRPPPSPPKKPTLHTPPSSSLLTYTQLTSEIHHQVHASLHTPLGSHLLPHTTKFASIRTFFVYNTNLTSVCSPLNRPS